MKTIGHGCFITLIFIACFQLNAGLGKSFADFWTPPAPLITNKQMRVALQEHKDIERSTNLWFLPSRSALVGSLSSLAGYGIGKTLPKLAQLNTVISSGIGKKLTQPLITSAITGLVGTGITWLLLSRHSNIKKRQSNQDLLATINNIFHEPDLVLDPEVILKGYQTRIHHYQSMSDRPAADNLQAQLSKTTTWLSDVLKNEGCNCDKLDKVILSTPTPNPGLEDEIPETGPRAEQIGNKASNLERLQALVLELNKSTPGRFHVPPLFAISHKQVERLLGRNTIAKINKHWQRFCSSFENNKVKAFQELQSIRDQLTNSSFKAFMSLIMLPPFNKPNALGTQLSNFLSQAQGVKLMVRSTGREDSTQFANPGGNESKACVDPNIDNISEAIIQVLASYMSEKSINQQAIASKKIRGSVRFDSPYFPVFLQHMVQETKDIPISGVMYSQEAEGRTPGVVHIEATYGHNDGVVNGLVKTDSFHIGPTGIIHALIASKDERVVYQQGKALLTQNEASLRIVPCLDAQTIKDLAQAARVIEAEFKRPMDIEFTILNGTIHLLQARPLTDPIASPSYVKKEYLDSVQKELVPVQVIGAAGGKARVLRSPDSYIIAPSLRSGMAKYRTSRKQEDIQAIIVETTAPSTSHDAAMLRSIGIPAVYLAHASKQLTHDKHGYILDVQQGYLAPLNNSTPVETIQVPGWLCHPLVKRTSVIPHYLPTTGCPSFTHSTITLSDTRTCNYLQRTSIENLLQLLKQGDNKATITQTLQTIVARIERAIKRTKEEQAQLRQTNKETNKDLTQELDMLHQQVLLCAWEISQAMPVWLQSQQQTEDRITWLYPIVFLEALCKQCPHAEDYRVADLSVASLLKTEQQEQMLVEKYEFTKKPSRDYLVQCAKGEEFVYTAEIEKQWRDYLQWVANKPQTTQTQSKKPLIPQQLIGLLVAQFKQLGILQLWLNGPFAQAYKKHAKEKKFYITVTKELLSQYEQSIGTLQAMHETVNRLNAFDTRVFAMPAHFETQLKALQEAIQYFSSDSFYATYEQAPQLGKWAMIATMQKIVECVDASIKAVEGSHEYLDRDQQAQHMKTILLEYFKLLKIWISIPSINATLEKLCTPLNAEKNCPLLLQNRIAALENTLSKLVPKANMLCQSKWFNVTRSILTSTSRGQSPQTLDDLFTLIHQNLLVTLSILLCHEGIQELVLPELVAQTCTAISSISINVHAQTPSTCYLVGILPEEKSLTFTYNLPIREHSNMFKVIYDTSNEKNNHVIVESTFVGEASVSSGDRWQERADWAYLFEKLTNIRLCGTPVIDSGRGLLTLRFYVSSQADAEKIAKFFCFLAQSCAGGGSNFTGLNESAGCTFETMIQTIPSMLDEHSGLIRVLPHIWKPQYTQMQSVSTLWQQACKIMRRENVPDETKTDLFYAFDHIIFHAASNRPQDFPLEQVFELLSNYLDNNNSKRSLNYPAVIENLMKPFQKICKTMQGSQYSAELMKTYQYIVSLIKKLSAHTASKLLSDCTRIMADNMLGDWGDGYWQPSELDFAFELAQRYIESSQKESRPAPFSSPSHDKNLEVGLRTLTYLIKQRHQRSIELALHLLGQKTGNTLTEYIPKLITTLLSSTTNVTIDEYIPGLCNNNSSDLLEILNNENCLFDVTIKQEASIQTIITYLQQRSRQSIYITNIISACTNLLKHPLAQNHLDTIINLVQNLMQQDASWRKGWQSFYVNAVDKFIKTLLSMNNQTTNVQQTRTILQMVLETAIKNKDKHSQRDEHINLLKELAKLAVIPIDSYVRTLMQDNEDWIKYEIFSIFTHPACCTVTSITDQNTIDKLVTYLKTLSTKSHGDGWYHSDPCSTQIQVCTNLLLHPLAATHKTFLTEKLTQLLSCEDTWNERGWYIYAESAIQAFKAANEQQLAQQIATACLQAIGTIKQLNDQKQRDDINIEDMLKFSQQIKSN